MGENSYITRIGGENYRFPQTQWTLINNLDDHKKVIEEYIFTVYWKPLYFYLIRKGFSNEEAKDYTQDFLFEILYGRELLTKVCPGKGKFRSYLLASFENFVKCSHRKNKLKCRSLNSQEYEIPNSLPYDPSDAFDYAWAMNILDKVIEQVKMQCIANDLQIHWQIFEEKILYPLLENCSAPPLSNLCEKYNIVSVCQISNMLVTVKRRFQKTLMSLLSANQPDSDETVVFQNFLRIFSK